MNDQNSKKPSISISRSDIPYSISKFDEIISEVKHENKNIYNIINSNDKKYEAEIKDSIKKYERLQIIVGKLYEKYSKQQTLLFKQKYELKKIQDYLNLPWYKRLFKKFK